MDTEEFTKREYVALKTELLERIRIINSQASNAIITILTVWSIAIALTVVCYSGEIKNELSSRFILENMRNMIFLIPILFFLPLSIKSGENIKQQASISLIMFTLSAISTYYFFRDKEIGLFETINYIKVLLMIYWIITCAMFLLIMAIHHALCVRVNSMDAAAWYLAGYIELAKERGILKPDECERAYEVLSPFCKISDREITIKTMEKFKYKFSLFKRIFL